MSDIPSNAPPAHLGGYNNCHVAGSMTEDQRERAMERYYSSLPMTKEKEEWFALFSPTVDLAQPKKDKKSVKKKKPNLQPKINKLFEHEKNKDGYEMRFCKYQPEVGDYVYVPPGYGKISARRSLAVTFAWTASFLPASPKSSLVRPTIKLSDWSCTAIRNRQRSGELLASIYRGNTASTSSADSFDIASPSVASRSTLLVGSQTTTMNLTRNLSLICS